MWGTEFSCDGVASLDEVEGIAQDVARAVARAIKRTTHGFTVRVGRPEIVPLRGAHAGARVVPEGFSPISIVATALNCGSEMAWFDANSSPRWSGETDARVTEAPWIRLYAKDLDACLAVEIDSLLSLRERALQNSIRDVQLGGWAKSVFCLTPAWSTWVLPPAPEPDETALIARLGRQLNGWYHASILGGPLPMRSTDPELPHPFTMDDSDEAARLELIRSQLKQHDDVELVPAAEARHLLAANGHDPLPEPRRKLFHTGEVLSYLEECPSPLLPQSRRLTLTTAWRISSGLDLLQNAVAWACYESLPELGLDWEVTDEGTHAEVAIKMFASQDLQTQPTNQLLERAYAWAREFISAVKRRVGGTAQLATREYWRMQHEVTLGMPFESSGKEVLGTMIDGKWVPWSSAGS
jgi:hypothetical protein